MMHLLRCAPCHNHPGLQEFDKTLREGLCSLTNCHISDTQWIQATLPIRDGGLGLRRVSQLALSAFLASAAGTSQLQTIILGGTSFACVDSVVDAARLEWCQLSNSVIPSTTTAHLQRFWDAPNVASDKAHVAEAASMAIDKARLLAVTSAHASDWIHALPISTCGLRLDNETIRIAVGLRLGLELCEVHQCPCGSTIDTRGNHGLSCRQSTGRSLRHHQLNDLYRGSTELFAELMYPQ